MDFDSSHSDDARQRLDAARRIQEALDNNWLTPVYRPPVDVTTGQIPGFEALARIAHPERGLIPPAAFIEVCEETDLILRVVELMVTMATRQISQVDRGPRTDRPVQVSVNVASPQLAGGSLPATVKKAGTGSGPVVSPGEPR